MAKEKKVKEEKAVFGSKAEMRAAALDALNKKFGKGTIFEFSKHPLPKVECTPTGSPGLDIALGGGYPRGRIIEIWGQEASGKCLTKDTLISTPTGQVSIETLFLANGVDLGTAPMVCPRTVALLNEYNQVENTKSFTCNGVQPVFLITLEDGTTIKSTINHPHRVVMPHAVTRDSRQILGKNTDWKETGQVIVGDLFILLNTTTGYYSFAAVQSVLLVGEEPTFDFEMSETHSFIANGIVTHNTTTTLHAIAEIQKLGGAAAFVDAEHALDPAYARQLGVDVDKLFLSQPDSAEQALSVVEELVSSGGFDIVVIDSVAALVPQAELDADMGAPQMGLQARLMSQALRKITAIASKTNTIVFFINQTRSKIGVMFGDPSTTTGGNALKFYASVRMQVTKQDPIKNGDEVIGNLTKVKVVKNKIAPPFKTVEFDLFYGKGISREGDLVTLAVKYGVFEKTGAWYSYLGERIGQGHNNTCMYLAADPKLAAKIEEEIKAKAKIPTASLGSGSVPLTEPIVFETEEEIPEDAE